ncbi:MAG TPA: ABC transporter ATP-binding protein [Polyangia bacterium]|nr:ABC transporter ATP-binding protein [Polyangia bacterium]
MGRDGSADGFEAGTSPAPRLKLTNVSKSYPGVQANDRVNLTVMPGEIHAVLGENGAGKSTLMKIIYGAVRPDEGVVEWNGRAAQVHNPRQARALGVAMVFQHFALFETLTVAENVWLGLDEKMPRGDLVREVERVARHYGLELDPTRLVSSLSVGERQRVEILRALLAKPQLLILDEPTAVLTPQMAERLFITLRQLAAGGCSILYISHKLDEVRALCMGCTVLRGGRAVGNVDPRTETNRSLSELMLGEAPPAPPVRAAKIGEAALEVRSLSLPAADERGVALAGVDFGLRAGEILGVAGVSGNGQAELLAALSGEDRRAPGGTIRLFGRDVSGAAPRARRAQGLHFVPEERIGRGSVPGLPLAANTLLTRREPVGPGGWLRRGMARRLAARLIERFGVSARGPESAAGSLSGGNLQKFIVGREVDAKPKVLIVAQPTWGLDVGAAAQIRREIAALCDAGGAALVVSEDLEELFELATDLVVIARGRLSPRIAVRDATPALIGQWMSGLFGEGTHEAAAPAGSPRVAAAEAHA